MFSKDTDEKHVMHAKDDHIEIMIIDTTDEVIKEFFQSLFCIYQIGLETSKKGTAFIMDCIHLLCY